MAASVSAEFEGFEEKHYVGCRAFPILDEVKQAIAITRSAFERSFGAKAPGTRSKGGKYPSLPATVEERLNLAILYVVWHQNFAVAHRATTLPYIPSSSVSSSGLATLMDKDSGTGYKARLVWLPPGLLEDMRVVERSFSRDPEGISAFREEYGCIFFLRPFRDDPSEMRICSRTIEQVSRPFFPFPANMPRRTMRYLLMERGVSSERVDMFMGHWRERKEPWGKWSSFDTGDYLRELRQMIPEILAELGFGAAPR